MVKGRRVRVGGVACAHSCEKLLYVQEVRIFLKDMGVDDERVVDEAQDQC